MSTDLLARWFRTIVRNASNFEISNLNQAEYFYSQKPNKEIQSIPDISTDLPQELTETPRSPKNSQQKSRVGHLVGFSSPCLNEKNKLWYKDKEVKILQFWLKPRSFSALFSALPCRRRVWVPTLSWPLGLTEAMADGLDITFDEERFYALFFFFALSKTCVFQRCSMIFCNWHVSPWNWMPFWVVRLGDGTVTFLPSCF